MAVVPYLLLVSLIWAASFSLIKTYLAKVSPDLVNLIRLGLTLLVFLPFLRWRRTGGRLAAELVAVGALQFGAMCFFYTRSFGTLKAHEAALATVMTPLYVVILDGILERRLRLSFLGCALLSALGTAICLGLSRGLATPSARGLMLVQASNLCFAGGQVWYRRTMARASTLSNAQAFAWCALGAAALAAAAAFRPGSQGLPSLGRMQWGVLIYLGTISSGLCFFLWNVGSRRVNAGVLAVMNDLKIPAAVLIALLFFGERAAWSRLGLGGSIVILAWWIASRKGWGSPAQRECVSCPCDGGHNPVVRQKSTF